VAVVGTTLDRVPSMLEVGPDSDDMVQQVWSQSVEYARRVCVLAAGDPGFFGWRAPCCAASIATS